MNVFKLIAVYAVITLFVFPSVSGRAYASPSALSGDRDGLLFDEDIAIKLQNTSGPIDAQFTSEVRRRIRQYLRNKKNTENILARRDLYFPLFDRILTDEKLPEELKYLAIVESGLNPTARSGAGAVGLWQLMKGTGKMLGLDINRTVDHRKDPYRSTQAAIEYLKRLYASFDDWTLAIAAYNSGPGRVRKAIKRSGSRDFWKLKQYLPKETRDYVPAFIAASYVLNYYSVHQLEPRTFDDDLRITSTIKIYDRVGFEELSRWTGVSKDTIQILNPGYLRHYIPKDRRGNYLVLPAMGMNKYLEILWGGATAPAMEYVQIKSLEEFSSVRKINAVDPLTMVYANGSLKTGRPSARDIKGVIPRFRKRKKNIKYYRLKRRESLSDLADRSKNITVSDLMEWNDFSNSNPPKPGMLIKVIEE